MKKTITLLFLIATVFVLQAQYKVDISATPNWVSVQEYDDNPEVDENEITQGTLTLLADYQVNLPRQEMYFRLVSKITDNVGIQSASNISTDYDPSYQKLMFHHINVIRNGTIIKKLNADHFQVIRRELNAENFLYDGSYSAMLNMSDIRDDDIIDFSYTVKGFNPIQNGKYANSFILTDYVPIGKINVVIQGNQKVHYKLFNTNQDPVVSTKRGLKQYQWTVTTPTPFSYEENMPTWRIAMPTVVIGQYDSWHDVAQWADTLFDFNEPLSADLKKKINEIDTQHKNQAGKIKEVLNFVQNDIRYLGLEYGIGSYKPNSPNKVFDQRYGDCKDKSLLMVEMLRYMGIKADPMLVHSALKNTIINFPPSPEFFDHCVVKVVDAKNNLMYYDPTISNQGGTYNKIHFPNYEYGLVVDKNTTAFDTIISSSNNKVTTLEEFVIKDLKGNATLDVTTTYTDVEADRMRTYFKNSSQSNIVKEYENYYSNYHEQIRISKSPVIEDDSLNNVVVIKESYVIDSIWQPIKLEPDKIFAEFAPISLIDILYIPNMENRTHAMQLPYPVSREHVTKVRLPQNWTVPVSSDLISNDIFYYDYDVSYDKAIKEVTVKCYLKIQKPAIEPQEFDTYYNDIMKLDQIFGITLYIPKDGKNNLVMNSDGRDALLGLGIIAFIGIILVGIIVFVVIKLTSKSS